jgi:hypothetical protein
MPPDLVLLPYTQARAALHPRALRLLMLTPPYPALGVGALRALRVTPPVAEDGTWELVAGYEGYERLP